MESRGVGLAGLLEGLRQRLVELGAADIGIAAVDTAANGGLQHGDGVGRAVEREQASRHHEISAGVAVGKGIEGASKGIYCFGVAAFPLQQHAAQGGQIMCLPSKVYLEVK